MLSLLLVVAAVGATSSAVAAKHVVRDHETVSQLLWNQHRAYLIVGMRRDAWSGSQAEYLWQVVKGLAGGAFNFQQSRQWLVLATIDANSVSRVVQDGETFQFIGPFEGKIYDLYGPIRKWTGQRFEQVSETEAARFKAAKRSGEMSYSNLDGWSSRISLLNQGNGQFEYPLVLGGTSVTVIADKNSQRATLRVVGAQREPVEIISVDERFRTVGPEDYNALLHMPLKD